MNRYKEAFYHIFPKKEFNYIFPQFVSITKTWEIYRKDYETLKELVERATPKKPEYYSEEKDGYWSGDVYFKGGTTECWECPSCGSFICYVDEENICGDDYCPTCGQALDWSDENDS